MDKVARSYPVVTIMGPRQSGKTTLVQAQFSANQYRNLKAEDVLSAAKADPRRFLMNGSANMVIDEILRCPSLLTYIQEMADANRIKGRDVRRIVNIQDLDAFTVFMRLLAGRVGELLNLPCVRRFLINTRICSRLRHSQKARRPEQIRVVTIYEPRTVNMVNMV